MENQNMKINMGEIITFSTGEYSDYGYCGTVIFTKNVDLIKFVQTEFVGKSYRELIIEDIASALVARELALPLQTREIYLGNWDFVKQFNMGKDGEKWVLKERQNDC